jgi:hypothetical protein
LEASSCPDCGFAGDLEVLKPQKQEMVDADHRYLITKLKCENCGCQFDVIERTELTYEITKHGHLGKMFGAALTPKEREEFETGLSDLQELLSKIFGSCSGDPEMLTILHNELKESIMLTRNFSLHLKIKSVKGNIPK